jgi:hypothetical protein
MQGAYNESVAQMIIVHDWSESFVQVLLFSW